MSITTKWLLVLAMSNQAYSQGNTSNEIKTLETGDMTSRCDEDDSALKTKAEEILKNKAKRELQCNTPVVLKSYAVSFFSRHDEDYKCHHKTYSAKGSFDCGGSGNWMIAKAYSKSDKIDWAKEQAQNEAYTFCSNRNIQQDGDWKVSYSDDRTTVLVQAKFFCFPY